MNSQRKAQAKFDRWEPKTREEAQRKWKKLQDTPDHLNLLDLYRQHGIEPIKLAKCVFITPHPPFVIPHPF